MWLLLTFAIPLFALILKQLKTQTSDLFNHENKIHTLFIKLRSKPLEI